MKPVNQLQLAGWGGVMIVLLGCQPTVDCTRSIYLPAPPVVQEAPPPGEPPEMPSIQPQQVCDPPTPRLRVGRWCYDQAKQQGGATLKPEGQAFGPAASLTSVEGADVLCDWDNSPPLACWGPEGAPFEATVCGTCLQEETVTLTPTCAPGYSLEAGTCVYPGEPPGTPYCPPGWFMTPTGNCQAVAPPSLECPRNYTYWPDEACCIAQYMQPVQVPGIPSRTYSACPEGMEYDETGAACVTTYTFEYADCQTFSDYLGYCGGGNHGDGCQNPGQYGSQAACEAAGCTWTSSPGAVGGLCVY